MLEIQAQIDIVFDNAVSLSSSFVISLISLFQPQVAAENV